MDGFAAPIKNSQSDANYSSESNTNKATSLSRASKCLQTQRSTSTFLRACQDSYLYVRTSLGSLDARAAWEGQCWIRCVYKSALVLNIRCIVDNHIIPWHLGTGHALFRGTVPANFPCHKGVYGLPFESFSNIFLAIITSQTVLHHNFL